MNAHGRLAQVLGKSQYAAYIFHVPVILAFQYAALQVSLPPLAKFALVTLASVPATFALANAVRRPLHPRRHRTLPTTGFTETSHCSIIMRHGVKSETG